MIDFFYLYESYINAVSMFVFVIGLSGIDDNGFKINNIITALSFLVLLFSCLVNGIAKGF